MQQITANFIIKKFPTVREGYEIFHYFFHNVYITPYNSH